VRVEAQPPIALVRDEQEHGAVRVLDHARIRLPQDAPTRIRSEIDRPVVWSTRWWSATQPEKARPRQPIGGHRAGKPERGKKPTACRTRSRASICRAVSRPRRLA
jgi:hypothetical protein